DFGSAEETEPRWTAIEHCSWRELKTDPLSSVCLSHGGQTKQEPENAPGPWYVDTSCALCRMCLEEAPNLITYNRDETAVHFSKRSETPVDVDAAHLAIEFCHTLEL